MGSTILVIFSNLKSGHVWYQVNPDSWVFFLSFIFFVMNIFLLFCNAFYFYDPTYVSILIYLINYFYILFFTVLRDLMRKLCPVSNCSWSEILYILLKITTFFKNSNWLFYFRPAVFKHYCYMTHFKVWNLFMIHLISIGIKSLLYNLS